VSLGLGISLVLGVWNLDVKAMPETSVILNAPPSSGRCPASPMKSPSATKRSAEVVLVGIQRGGVPLAERLATLLAGNLGPPGTVRPA